MVNRHKNWQMIMTTIIRNNLTRRDLLAMGGAACALAALPAQALNTTDAKGLIDRVVARINQVINSGKPQSVMIVEFEKLFVDFADVNFIAFKTLGPPARSASKAQMRAFTKAFQGYMARKYGKRFREFIGGEIVVQKARKEKSHYAVDTKTLLKGRSPFKVTYLVSDKSGRDLFFDMRIEGVSLVNSEKEEIGALLDRNGGNIDRMIADLKKFG